MGFWSVLGSIGNALLSPVTSLITTNQTNKANERMTDETNEANLQISRENNQMQIDMNRENNQFNAAEAEKTRQYNSAAAQVQRFREAGINPAVAMSQGSATPAGASASSSGSGVTPSMPHLTPPQAVAPSLSAFDAFAGLKTLAEAKKSGVETSRLEKLMEEELRGLKLDNDQKSIIKEFLPEMQKSIIRKNVKQAFQFQKSAELYAEQGKTEETHRALNDAMKAFYEASKRMNEENARLLRAKADTWKTEVKSQIALNASQVGLNEAMKDVSQENKKLVAENVRDAVRRNDVIDLFNSRLTNLYDHNGFLDKKLSIYEKSVLAGLRQSVSQGQISAEQAKQLEQSVPYLIQQAKNDALKGKPWSAEYFKQPFLFRLQYHLSIHSVVR